MGRQAADRFAALLEADLAREVSRGYHEDLGHLDMKAPRVPDLQESRGVAVSEGRLGT